MKNLTKIVNKLKIPTLLIALLLGAVSIFALPHQASAQYFDDYGDDYGGLGYDSGYGYGGFFDDYGDDYGGLGYDSGYGYGGFYDDYGDDYGGLGYDSGYGYGGGYDDYYDGGYYDDCCDYTYDYGYNDYCCSYGNYGSYYPSSYYSTPPISYSNSSANASSHVVVNNNNTNNNTNNNSNHIVINTGGGNNTPLPQVNSLSVDCFGSPSNPDEDETVTWTASVSGGNGGYSYSWSGTNGLSGSGRTVQKRYSSSGTKNATVEVTSGNQSASAFCSVDVGNNNRNDLNVYCIGSPSNPDIDEEVRWTAYASGGDGDYNYRWSGDVSGNNRTEFETYGSSGTKDATIRVTSDGDTDTASCSVRVQSKGSNISNVTVYQPPSGNPSSGVFLSQIPATGISPTLKLVLFILGLTLWSAFAAYMLLERRRMAALSTVGVSEDVAILKVEAQSALETESNDLDNPLENDLSFRAREMNVLVSRDGLETIITRANGDQTKADSILSELVSKVSRNEGDYATLNAEKINQLLS